MEYGSWVWILSYMLHMVSNGIFLGMLMMLTFGDEELLKERKVKKYLKWGGVFLFLTGGTGILLLSILSMSGMDDLTNNPRGKSVLVMMIGYIIVLFIYSLALIYKGGEERLYKKMFGIIFFTYLIVYLIRGYLIAHL
ncbi:MAG: hypothetical protein DSY60_01720 [Persephonella sp.]|nr:MAG: hypothetical protein DSY60_01720 [Persephonella sp.]